MSKIFQVPQPDKDLLEKTQKVSQASIKISQSDNDDRIKAINLMADYLNKHSNKILEANIG